jgi:hypothetical protein
LRLEIWGLLLGSGLARMGLGCSRRWRAVGLLASRGLLLRG